MTTPKFSSRKPIQPAPRHCVIDGKPLRSNAERRSGLCAYHLTTLEKQ